VKAEDTERVTVHPAPPRFELAKAGLDAAQTVGTPAAKLLALTENRSSGIAAMNVINEDIQRSLFMPIFLGSTVTCSNGPAAWRR
jgi:hypothetical protein